MQGDIPHDILYSGKVWGGKFGGLGKSSVICQTKLVFTINNLLADLLIRLTFFRQMLEKSQFTKLPPHHTFPLYGTNYLKHHNTVKVPHKNAVAIRETSI